MSAVKYCLYFAETSYGSVKWSLFSSQVGCCYLAFFWGGLISCAGKGEVVGQKRRLFSFQRTTSGTADNVGFLTSDPALCVYVCDSEKGRDIAIGAFLKEMCYFFYSLAFPILPL